MGVKLEDYVAELRGLDETTFLTRHPHAVLLSEGAAGTAAIAGPAAPTRRVERSVVESARTKATPPPGADGTGQVVVCLRKTSSQHATIVTVGRGDECDVKLAHPLVSKKHAYFTQDEKGHLLADADSTNGTWVDGARLEPHKSARLSDGVGVRFGPGLRYRWFSARAFHELIALRARMK